MLNAFLTQVCGIFLTFFMKYVCQLTFWQVG